MVNVADVIRARRAKILEEAQRQAAALDDDAREIEKLVALADKHGFVLIPKAEYQNGAVSTANVNRSVQPVNMRGPAYRAAINVAEQAIKAAGVPLEFTELFDACVSLGVPLGGKRPQSTLSAYLSHEGSTVQSIRKGIYWLKGVPLPNKLPGVA